jgi:uncharacterized protein
VVGRLLLMLFIWCAAYATVLSIPEQYQLIGKFLWIPLSVLTVVSVGFAFISVRYQGYLLRQHDISFKSGFISRTNTTIPFNRIQHVEVNQSLVDRWLTLASLKVFTAGGSQSDLMIPGLHQTRANQLKQYLLGKMDNSEEEE